MPVDPVLTDGLTPTFGVRESGPQAAAELKRVEAEGDEPITKGSVGVCLDGFEPNRRCREQRAGGRATDTPDDEFHRVGRGGEVLLRQLKASAKRLAAEGDLEVSSAAGERRCDATAAVLVVADAPQIPSGANGPARRVFPSAPRMSPWSGSRPS